LAVVTVEVPSISQLLKPVKSKPSHSHSNTSPVSNDRSNSARIAALERRMDHLEEIEKIVHDLNRKLKDIGA